jgi:hypothetical protein
MSLRKPFFSKLLHIVTVEKSSQKMPQRKESPNGQKFSQSGHPDGKATSKPAEAFNNSALNSFEKILPAIHFIGEPNKIPFPFSEERQTRKES